ncbi:MAG: hypothetical protein JXR48_17390 [Candidatus Delongbacteria bacterium]|nr:hypothetical protein [Candidatus Delongbacteria bacterium]MBN2836734.1 hypothetical protein [Candidatus Delongbacteria bacterium]
MKRLMILVVIIFLASCSAVNQMTTSESYNGYSVLLKDNGDEEMHDYYIAITKNGNEILKFENAPSMADYNNFRFIDFNNDGIDELYVKQYSGGAHCCEFNYIISLKEDSPKFLFNSEEWGSVNFASELTDYDNNKTIEIQIQNITFDYFERCSHAVSPLSLASVFSYDYLKGKFTNQTEKFKNLMLDELKDESILDSIAIKFDLSDDPNVSDEFGENLGTILKFVLPYLYTGEVEKGWSLFDKYYTLSDKEYIRSKINEKLESDPLFNVK